MIHLIVGKPRNGKSLYAMRLLLEELQYGQRVVVTNIDLDRQAILSYLTDRGADVDLDRRLIVLDDPREMKQFWRWRAFASMEVNGQVVYGNPVKLQEQADEFGSLGDEAFYAKLKAQGGVFYVLDEVHILFSQFEWQKVNKEASFYFAQHGKLSDTVLLITQAPGLMAKPLRQYCQDKTEICNWSKKRFMSFRLPPRFVWARWSSVDAVPGSTPPEERGTFKLDVRGVASCYHTASGIGIRGGGAADSGDKVTGFPWWSAAIPLAVFAALLFYVPNMFGWGYKKVVARPEQKTVAPAFPVAPKPAAMPEQKTAAPVFPVAPKLAAMPEQKTEQKPVEMVGSANLGGDVRVWLSDGRVLRGREITYLDPRGRFCLVGDQVCKAAKEGVKWDPKRYAE